MESRAVPPKQEADVSALLAKTNVVAQRASRAAECGTFDDIVTADMRDGCANAGADERAVSVGRVDALRATSDSGRADKGGNSEIFGHLVIPVDELAGAQRAACLIGSVLQGRLVAALADTRVVTDCAGQAADGSSGCDVFVKRLGDDSTSDSATCCALRIGRQPSCGAVTLIAGGDAQQQKSASGNADEQRSLHVYVPVLWAPFRAGELYRVTMAQ